MRLEYSRAAARTGRAAGAMDALGPLLAALPTLAGDVAEDDAFAGDPPLCPIHRFAMIRRAGRLGVGWSCPVKGDDGS